jgi:hypothetical protein
MDIGSTVYNIAVVPDLEEGCMISSLDSSDHDRSTTHREEKSPDLVIMEGNQKKYALGDHNYVTSPTDNSPALLPPPSEIVATDDNTNADEEVWCSPEECTKMTALSVGTGLYGFVVVGPILGTCMGIGTTAYYLKSSYPDRFLSCTECYNNHPRDPRDV